MSHRVIISIGSNTQPARHISWAVERLSVLLSNSMVSRRLWTPDIKGRETMYLNQLLAATTDSPAEELISLLKEMETARGRRKGCVTLDLDLMSYDEERFHLSDWPRPYIQMLLGDLDSRPRAQSDRP